MSLIIAQVGNVAYTHTHINKPIEVLAHTRARTHTHTHTHTQICRKQTVKIVLT